MPIRQHAMDADAVHQDVDRTEVPSCLVFPCLPPNEPFHIDILREVC